MKTFSASLTALLLGVVVVFGQGIPRDPYNGAIVVDATTGDVLFEDGADRPGYPASMLKLMTLFVVLDRVEAGYLRLDEVIPVTKEAMRMGGSQVWLDPRESFPVDELLYALIIQSANDAAALLAQYVGGSMEGFVEMMNHKARELGLSPITRFRSPHGLPPGDPKVRHDMTTPRDFAMLCKALLETHPETLRYTSETRREFRANAQPPFQPMIMETHNHLLGKLPGCDGLKTGWIRASGYCIAVTAERNDRRVIAVVMGSEKRATRDAKASELINRWLPEAKPKSVAKPKPQPEPVQTVQAPEAADEAIEDEAADTPAARRGGRRVVGWLLAVGLVAVLVGLGVRRHLLISR